MSLGKKHHSLILFPLTFLVSLYSRFWRGGAECTSASLLTRSHFSTKLSFSVSYSLSCIQLSKLQLSCLPPKKSEKGMQLTFTKHFPILGVVLDAICKSEAF